MEYIRKMVLVLQDVYEAMQMENAKSSEIKEDKLHTILEDPKLPLDHRMKLYNQELQKTIDKNHNADREPTSDIEMDIDLHHKEIIERGLIGSLP